MDRADLERLDRESLVQRAQAAGIRRARVLTRPELIDELLRLDPTIDASQLKKTRGFFGIARDLLSRVVERGLHLPDAADRLRAALGDPLPHVPRPEPQAVPTVTLAEIYAAQGHKQRAIETLKRVLAAEPDHRTARSVLEKLEADDYIGPAPALPPEAEEPLAAEVGADLGSPAEEASGPATEEEDDPETRRLEPPETAPAPAVDECVAIPLAPGRLFVWWRLSDATAELVRTPPVFVVRIVVLVPTWDGPQELVRDMTCEPVPCETLLTGLPERAIVRVAVGRGEGDAFVPLAHSPAIEATANGLAQWTLSGFAPLPADDPRTAIARAERASRSA